MDTVPLPVRALGTCFCLACSIMRLPVSIGLSDRGHSLIAAQISAYFPNVCTAMRIRTTGAGIRAPGVRATPFFEMRDT